MLLSRGDPSIFITRPLSLAFLLMAFAMLIIIAVPAIRRRREDAFGQEREELPKK
jgi:TctA family transporter